MCCRGQTGPEGRDLLQVFWCPFEAHGPENGGAVDEAFRLIDESQAELLEDRPLQAVESALRDLESGARAEPTAAPEPGDTFIGPLTARLGIRPATLCKWERAGRVRLRRDPRTGYRVYDEAPHGTPGSPISSGGAAICWSRSPR